jgi:hypothetical protein
LNRLDKLDTILPEVILEMERSEATWINYFTLDHGCLQIPFNVQKLTRALQATHLCRLSVNLPDSQQLRQIFAATTHKAKVHHYQPMLCHRSDLFKIETSYLHDGQDVQLILHVPMTPSNSILRLFQLHPFLLPFTNTHFLMLDPSNQIQAISSRVDCLSVEMSVVKLMGSIESTPPTYVSDTASCGASSTPPTMAPCTSRTFLEQCPRVK